VVERQVDQIAQNLTEHRQEWRADKELQQYKERKDTIAAGKTLISFSREGEVVDGLQH